MSRDVNKVNLVGRVGRDPEIRVTPGGTRIANFSLATSESWKNKNTGEFETKTEWHRIVVMNDSFVDLVDKNITKGSRVEIEGQIKSRKYKDKFGEEKTIYEIFVGKFNSNLKLFGEKQTTEKKVEKVEFKGTSIQEDDIPF